MRVLLVSSRFPWPPYTGDRLRATVWLEALACHQVTLVTCPGSSPAGVPAWAMIMAPPSRLGLARALTSTLVHRLPFSSLLAAGHDWGRAIAQAERERGPFDVAIVLLARADPWVFGHLRARRKVLDGIDSLADNLGQRALEARGPMRLVWRLESARTRRLERGLIDRYDRVLVVADGERPGFGECAIAVPHGVRLGPAGEGERDIDVAFWGRLRYFANRDAAHVLLSEVWPRIRRELPDARLVVAGAEAPRFIQERDGRDGITVVSPMADRAALARRVRVALFPIRFGTGQANKVVEAGEASCAIVGTLRALCGVGPLAAVAEAAESPADLARVTVELLRDERARAERGRSARDIVERVFSREQACECMREAVLAGL